MIDGYWSVNKWLSDDSTSVLEYYELIRITIKVLLMMWSFIINIHINTLTLINDAICIAWWGPSLCDWIKSTNTAVILEQFIWGQDGGRYFYFYFISVRIHKSGRRSVYLWSIDHHQASINQCLTFHCKSIMIGLQIWKVM